MGRRGQEPRALSLLPTTHPEPGELSQPQGSGKGQGEVQKGGRVKRREPSCLWEKGITSGRQNLPRLEDREARFQGMASTGKDKWK